MDSYGKPPGTVLSPPQGDAGSPSPTDLLSRQPLQEQAWPGADPATLQLIARLFPSPTLGQTFVARFVERAARERSSIPGLRTGDVIICAKSIAELAEELSLAYDTTQKYVVLFQSLGLLQKRKFMGLIAFVLSLGIYHTPPALEANLNYLIQRSQAKKSRSKFHGLVKETKQRCLVYGLIDQEWTAALHQLHQLVQAPVAGTSRSRLEQRLAQAQHLVSRLIAQAMTERLPREEDPFSNLPGSPEAADEARQDMHLREGESTQRGESTKRGISEIQQQNLPGVTQLRDTQLHHQGSKSSQVGRPGRFVEGRAVPNLTHAPARVDSPQSNQPTESTQTGKQGRRSNRHDTPNPPASAGQIDSPRQDHSHESAQASESGRFPAQETPQNLPRQASQVDSELAAHVHVDVMNLIKNNITSNVRLVATFCRSALEEPPTKQRIYLNLLDECERDAEAITAALLFTLAHKRDGTMTKPAAVFLARCRDFHQVGVSEEAAALVQQYGSLSYLQLLTALQKKTTVPSTTSKRGTSPPASSARSTTPTSLPPLPRWGTIQRFIAIEDGRPGMSREEALLVIGLARGDRRTKMCRVDLEQLPDGSFAVLLDNTITAIPRQTFIYSEQDWRARTSGIQDSFELFGATRTGRRCLADALKERRAKP